MTAEIPPAPDGAHRLFGERRPRAEAFVAILADTGVSHGLIGPREVDRLWERHVLNCALLADAIDEVGATDRPVGTLADVPDCGPDVMPVFFGPMTDVPRHPVAATRWGPRFLLPAAVTAAAGMDPDTVQDGAATGEGRKRRGARGRQRMTKGAEEKRSHHGESDRP